MAGPSAPSPPSFPAWCHLSSVSLQKGHDYSVSIWKLPCWHWSLTHGHSGAVAAGLHMLRLRALQPWVFHR